METQTYSDIDAVVAKAKDLPAAILALKDMLNGEIDERRIYVREKIERLEGANAVASRAKMIATTSH